LAVRGREVFGIGLLLSTRLLIPESSAPFFPAAVSVAVRVVFGVTRGKVKLKKKNSQNYLSRLRK
jgi:small basic protein